MRSAMTFVRVHIYCTLVRDCAPYLPCPACPAAPAPLKEHGSPDKNNGPLTVSPISNILSFLPPDPPIS